jgi:hypothetical protein
LREKSYKTLLFWHPVKNYRDQNFPNLRVIWSIKYMKSKIAKGEINSILLFRKSPFYSFLYYIQVICQSSFLQKIKKIKKETNTFFQLCKFEKKSLMTAQCLKSFRQLKKNPSIFSEMSKIIQIILLFYFFYMVGYFVTDFH